MENFIKNFSKLDMDLINKLENIYDDLMYEGKEKYNLSEEKISKMLTYTEDLENFMYNYIKNRLESWKNDIQRETEYLLENDIIDTLDYSAGLYNMDRLYINGILEYNNIVIK